MEFLKKDVEKIRDMISRTKAVQGIKQPQGLDECKQGVIAAAAMALVSIVLSEMNEKGKFNWFAGFRVIGKLVKAVNEIVAQFKACQG